MKIVHVYCQNLSIFADAVQGTDLMLNASQDLDYLIHSVQNYNARDVIGLVVFANPVTKKCLRLVKTFDEMFVYKKMPIVVITDRAKALYSAGYFHTTNSAVFLLDSEENSISDVDIDEIFTTLLAFSGSTYDLSVIAAENKRHHQPTIGAEEVIEISPALKSILESIEGSRPYEDSFGGSKTQETFSLEAGQSF